MANTPRPHPLASSSDSEVPDLIRELAAVRRKLRLANQERGKTSLTLHMTRLDLQKARQDARKAEAELETQAGYARGVYYRLREVMEIVRPGMTHGDLDEDYKLLLAEVRRLHGSDIVARFDADNAAEVVPLESGE